MNGRARFDGKKVRRALRISLILLIGANPLGSGCTTTSPSPSQTYHPELEYLKSLHQAGPVTEPQLVTVLSTHETPQLQLQRVLRSLRKYAGPLSAGRSALRALAFCAPPIPIRCLS